MDRSKEMIWILALAAAVLSAAVMILSFGCRTATPALLRADPEAVQQVTQLMEAVVSGDLQQAGDFFYGKPDLNRMFPEDNPVLEELLPALWESLDYTVEDRIHAEGTTLTLSLTIDAMDAGKAMAEIQPKIEQILSEELEDPKHYKDIFGDDGGYQEDFIDSTVHKAVTFAIGEAETRSETVTVHLSLEDGQWKILPEEALLQALTGWITAA